ncbi:MAG: sigma-70 family RNA polymerase sigma factor [Phycisphaerales bacterium]
MDRTETAQPRRARDRACLSRTQFAEFFQESWRTLWCVAAAVLGSRDEVEDVLQEAALIAFGKLGDFDPQTNFAAWMAQIVRYTALNTARRRARRQAVVSIHDDLLEQPAGSEHRGNGSASASGKGNLPAYEEAFDDRLLGALKSLGETPRACLLLRTVEEMSYREISEILGIPEGTAMSHVHRTRQALRERLAPIRGSNSRAEDGS